MKKGLITAIILFAVINVCQAQKENSIWGEPELTNLSESELEEDAIVTKLLYRYDYKDSKNIIKHLHKKIRINKSKAIDEYNKIFFSKNNVASVLSIQARSISPEGEVVYFDRNTLKEVKSSKYPTSYRIFAIDGLKEGSEFEYIIKLKMKPYFYGREFLQNDIPIKSAAFQLNAPSHLYFSFESYNGFTKITDSRDNLGGHCYSANEFNIPAIKTEKYAFTQPQKRRVEFKLYSNSLKSSRELFTWQNAADYIVYENYILSDRANRYIRKFNKQINVSNSISKVEKIKLIENFVKTNINQTQHSDKQYGSIKYIYKNRVANRKGLLRLFCNLFRENKIEHRIVYTTERDYVRFDNEFPAWNYLHEALIYFPGLDLYLSPYESVFRLGLYPYTLNDNYGIFIRRTYDGYSVASSYSVEYIKSWDYKKNYLNTYVESSLDENLESCKLNLKIKMGGFRGQGLLSAYARSDSERKTEILKDYLEKTYEKTELDNAVAKNDDLNNCLYETPFLINAQLSSEEMLEYAGEKIIVNIGKMIGRQSELYQEDERKLNVEIHYKHDANRVIVFTIPEGYEVSNLDKLYSDEVVVKENEEIYGFQSNYKLEGNKLKVTIKEFYKEINCDVNEYPGFQKVINAAADFNKKSIILVKKELTQL